MNLQIRQLQQAAPISHKCVFESLKSFSLKLY